MFMQFFVLAEPV